MRVLASVRRVRDIQPIEGADLIVKTQVDGWQCVTKKGEFKVGDYGVYFEIDSFLDGQDPRYAFLSKQFINFEGNLGARIRTIKLKGQIAQGLMLPMSAFPEVLEYYEGMDLTQMLKVKKWEPVIPACLAGEVVGPMPEFIRKTDEERIQNLIDEIPTEIAGRRFEKTIKLDGTSMTVFKRDQRHGVCGRNWELRETANNTLWSVARRNQFLEALEGLGQNIALQGELMGEGIQENNEKIKGQEFYLFKIWMIDEQRYMSPDERQETVEKLIALGASLKLVPSLGFVEFSQDVTVRDILNMADGPSLFAPNREGLVLIREDGLFSCKAISDWYLAKHSNR